MSISHKYKYFSSFEVGNRVNPFLSCIYVAILIHYKPQIAVAISAL